MTARKNQAKVWLLRLLVVVLVCWGLSVIVSLFGNPEVRFWSRVVEDKIEVAKKTRSEVDGPFVFVGGGSSASFSIHPKVLTEELGVPAFNMGGSGGMGYRYLVNLAFSEAQSGDIVILHMTAESMAAEENPTMALGIRVALRNGQFTFAEGGPIFESGQLGLGDRLLALRPGAKFLATMAVKFVSGRPLYSYSLSDFEDGVVTIPNGGPTGDVEGVSPTSTLFNEGTVKILQEIVEYASARQIHVFYTLPWECFLTEACPAMREEHEKYLKQVERYMPVLRDSKAGAHDRPEDFLDTGFHMNLKAGKTRTRMLARSLQNAIDLESRDR